jgi:PBP1b-binding outer membrane lipoprotein LpoB
MKRTINIISGVLLISLILAGCAKKQATKQEETGKPELTA